MENSPITDETIVDDLMSKNHKFIRPFLDRKMLCVGCPVAKFHTIAYACEKHHVNLDEFLFELKALI